MKIFNQNKSAHTTGLKLATLVAMLLSSFGAFANTGEGGLNDTSLTYILVAMILAQVALLYVISSVFKSLTGNVNLWKKYLPKSVSTGALTLILLLSGSSVFAQDGTSQLFVLDSSLEILLISINGFLLLVIAILLLNVKKIIGSLKADVDENEVAEEAGLFDSIGLTDAIPIENENDILLDHDYDGIHELDNNLPPWWLWGFYITIFFAIIYMWYYFTPEHSSVGDNEYVAEMKLAEEEAAERGASVDENSVVLLTAEADIAAGKEIFSTNCVACHLANGGGSVGPNLTDEFWKHGGGIKNVFHTIKYGVPEKGMIAWESQLSPTDMQKVASFVLSLQGTNPEGGKAPEGDKWTGE